MFSLTVWFHFLSSWVGTLALNPRWPCLLRKRVDTRTNIDPRTLSLCPPPLLSTALLCLLWRDKWALIDWYWLELYFPDGNGPPPRGITSADSHRYPSLLPPLHPSLHVPLVLRSPSPLHSRAPRPLIKVCSLLHVAFVCVFIPAEQLAGKRSIGVCFFKP